MEWMVGWSKEFWVDLGFDKGESINIKTVEKIFEASIFESVTIGRSCRKAVHIFMVKTKEILVFLGDFITKCRYILKFS